MRKLRLKRNGMSLIEGMISMAVLVIGILGALQGILFASQQNSVAARLARASSMGAQVRQGLEAQGRAKLASATGIFGDSSTCLPIASATALLPFTDGVHATGIAGTCIVDLDAFDSSAAAADKIVTTYDLTGDYNSGNGLYRRMLVYSPVVGGVDNVAVVVSTRGVGRRIFARQFVGLVDVTVTGNGTGVEL